MHLNVVSPQAFGCLYDNRKLPCVLLLCTKSYSELTYPLSKIRMQLVGCFTFSIGDGHIPRLLSVPP